MTNPTLVNTVLYCLQSPSFSEFPISSRVLFRLIFPNPLILMSRGQPRIRQTTQKPLADHAAWEVVTKVEGLCWEEHLKFVFGQQQSYQRKQEYMLGRWFRW